MLAHKQMSSNANECRSNLFSCKIRWLQWKLKKLSSSSINQQMHPTIRKEKQLNFLLIQP